MGCMIEFRDPLVRFDFCANPAQQKLWIDALLHYSNLDLTGLSTLLEIPRRTLTKVHQGEKFLETEQAIKLGQLFLIHFGG